MADWAWNQFPHGLTAVTSQQQHSVQREDIFRVITNFNFLKPPLGQKMNFFHFQNQKNLGFKMIPKFFLDVEYSDLPSRPLFSKEFQFSQPTDQLGIYFFLFLIRKKFLSIGGS